MQAPSPSPLAVRPRDAARMLSISERTLWSLTAPRGPIPCVRIGTGKRKIVLYEVNALRRWLQHANQPRSCWHAAMRQLPQELVFLLLRLLLMWD